jgi:hypothetical protein
MGGDVTVTSVYGEGSVFTALIPQTAESGTPFARAERPEEKAVLVYENPSLYLDSILWSLENLGVPHTLVSTREDFSRALGGGRYAFVFVGYSVYREVQEILASSATKPGITLLAAHGAEDLHHVRLLTMPAHVLSTANILNNKRDPRDYTDQEKTFSKFAAPAARILIVDDIVTNLKVAEGLMVPYQMNIDICKSGAESIEYLMDHMMPGMDGIEAVNIIRRPRPVYSRGNTPRVSTSRRGWNGTRTTGPIWKSSVFTPVPCRSFLTPCGMFPGKT